MKYRTLLLTGVLLAGLLPVFSTPVFVRALQFSSGWLAAFFIGAPSCADGDLIRIFVSPHLTVSEACSGVRFFTLIVAVVGGYWCGTHFFRWLLSLPSAFLITVLVNASRIAVAWHFRRMSAAMFPEWFQEYVHMGIGIICFLSVLVGLLYWINRKPLCEKEIVK